MSIEQLDETSWQLLADFDGHTVIDVDVEVTENGIEVEGELIPWPDIDAARTALQE